MTDTLAPPPTGAKHRTRRRRSRFGTVVFIALLVALGLVATGVLPVRDYVGRENSVNVAQNRLTELQEQNASLADDAEALYSEQELERVAREQYGFVLPGEIGYVVLTPGTPEASRQVAEPVATTERDRSFLGRIWDFITGSDIASDG
ncbi:MAG: hypothetical protein BMS9Abin20_1002 [Acidimicrobiia bacterium]|nr:MAG: hypothetical protein BMS9Abin20_1002 [Acidimicrobiia bacterium]